TSSRRSPLPGRRPEREEVSWNLFRIASSRGTVVSGSSRQCAAFPPGRPGSFATAPMTPIYLGNDISKGYLDACFLNAAGHRLAPARRYDDTPTGHAALATALADLAARYPDATFVVG